MCDIYIPASPSRVAASQLHITASLSSVGLSASPCVRVRCAPCSRHWQQQVSSAGMFKEWRVAYLHITLDSALSHIVASLLSHRYGSVQHHNRALQHRDTSSEEEGEGSVKSSQEKLYLQFHLPRENILEARIKSQIVLSFFFLSFFLAFN